MKIIIGNIIFFSTLLTFAALTDVSYNVGLIIKDAEAVVGRPWTPGSVAGVARRTTRRTIRRTTAYVATLPRGCSTTVIEGMSLYQCGGTYYQPYGGRYVVVTVY